jgi:hypothetical protein
MAHRSSSRSRCFALLFLGAALAPQPRAEQPLPTSAPAHRLRVGVLPVTLTSDDRALADSAEAQIQEELGDLLFRQGSYGLVERTSPTLVDRIMAELEFQNGGLVAPQETKALGRLAGIEVFVQAEGELSVKMLGSILTLRVKLIDVESSKLLGLFQVRSRSRARLNSRLSVREAVTGAMASLASQLRDYHLPPADSM